MIVPYWIWCIFLFALGCCVGSFLNVVIYRMPREKSLITPPSACPACDRRIAFYDNIPLVSWLLLRAKCRYCKAPISPRYFIIELLTGSVFAGLFILYFHFGIMTGIGPLVKGSWFVYLLHVILLSAFIAASAIDMELWIIPLPICWFVTAVGFIGSALGVYIIEPAVVRGYALLPNASTDTASLAVGAAIGIGISNLLLVVGLFKRSYESEDKGNPETNQDVSDEKKFNDRIEILKEIIFLLPIIICSFVAYRIIREYPAAQAWWIHYSQHPVFAGLLGSLWGYIVGCAVVWATRIFGTLGFGKEAMGLGDVHLMGAAGAVIGPVFVVLAFFIAPFFGLAWAGFQMFFKKTRQIPYGSFLSLGILTVMIFHDRIFSYLMFLFYR